MIIEFQLEHILTINTFTNIKFNLYMSNNSAPISLTELYEMVQTAAVSYGYQDGKNGLFRDCVTNKSKNPDDLIRKPKENEANFWFGYIREDQPTNGAYEGLSFVIFPEHENTRCLVAIGIGSSSIGKDSELAANPGFRRSFLRLNNAHDSNAVFFYKLRFDEMETSTPGLQEELGSDEKRYEDVLIDTSTKYNADLDKETPGLLPAVFIVDYSTIDGWDLIQAWLAQYAKWRCWNRFMKGTEKVKMSIAVNNAIAKCRNDAYCPDAEKITEILLNKSKYVVLQGAPGCGKTWTANRVAEVFDDVIFTQFHAETTYSDFVFGIRPSLNGKDLAYTGEKGTLLKAIEKANAIQSEGKKVLLIIDEINRANLSNVLGPVFYLFEPNVTRKHKLHLGTIYNQKTESEEQIELSELPDNLYVLGTMNTADRSLAVVDFALKRRFAWVTLRPHKLPKDIAPDFDEELFDKVDNLFTTYATDEELNLQPGQSYFMDKSKRADCIRYGLMPLMKEYFAEGFLISAKEEFAQLFTSYSGDYMYE